MWGACPPQINAMPRLRKPLRKNLRAGNRKARRSFAQAQRMRRIARNIARQHVHKFSRTLYSSAHLASGDYQQQIYIGSDYNNPLRVYDTGTGSFVNANNYTITWQPSNMQIAFWQDSTYITTYVYNVPELGELTRLFDQMQIDWVELEWFFSASAVINQDITFSGGGGPTRPVMGQPVHLYVKDYDDARGMKFTELVQYENQKSWQMGTSYQDSRHRIRIKPKLCMNASDAEGTTTGVMVPQNTRQYWLDTTRGQNVDHYGLKGTINNVCTVTETDPADTHVLGVLGFRATYHYRFKNVK